MNRRYKHAIVGHGKLLQAGQKMKRRLGVESTGRFIEEQQRWVAHERALNRKTLPLAGKEALDGRIGLLGDSKHAQRMGCLESWK